MNSDNTKESVEPLLSWVRQQAERLNGTRWDFSQPVELNALSGDAGFRRYFRVNCRPSLLAVSAPVASEDSRAFVAIARYLKSQQVDTPEIIAVDFQRGFLLVEDFGDSLLGSVLNPDNVDRCYAEAMEILLRLQACTETSIAAADDGDLFTLAPYNSTRLLDEMLLFQQWFVPKLLGYQLSGQEQHQLQQVYDQLLESALEQPRVWVHRDFHSRNLIYREGQLPGVIDFQDAVEGPLTYDLVSLLRDCYLRWPAVKVSAWALQYRDLAVAHGLMNEVSDAEFLRWFDWMGLQRHIKVLGIFARLWLRDGKAGYLNDLPLVIRYTLEVADRYPQFESLVTLFQNRLLPLCEQQAWYRDYLKAGNGV